MSPFKLSLPLKIFIALILGCIAGIILEYMPPGTFRDAFLANGLLRIGGTVFINAFKLIVGPVVFCSLVLGMTDMDTPFTAGRIGIKTLLLYLVTTLAAIVLGIATVMIAKPGVGQSAAALPEHTGTAPLASDSANWAQTIINVVPDNIFKAFYDNSMLQIIFVSILCGVALIMLGEKTAGVKKLLRELNLLNVKIIDLVLQFAPVGVFCLISSTILRYGSAAMLPLVKLLVCLAAAMVLLFVLVYFPMLKFFAKMSIRRFMVKYYPVILLGFSTSSSNASLPVNLETVTDKIGVREDISSMVLSLGATINMNGTAIMLGCCSVFVAQFYGIELTFAQLGAIILTAITASVGTAGVPGAGVIMLVMVLQSVNLPLEGCAIIMGIERFADMLRTAANITGDAVCACVVARSENAIDYTKFNADQEV